MLFLAANELCCFPNSRLLTVIKNFQIEKFLRDFSFSVVPYYKFYKYPGLLLIGRL